MQEIRKAIDARMNAIIDNQRLSAHKPLMKVRGPRNERDEYLDYFHDRLKDGYKQKTGKALTKKYLAVRIAHLKTIQDLHYLRHICEEGESKGKPFAFVFWGSLKVRPAVPNQYPDA